MRRTKQFIYGLIYLVFWVAIVAGIYFLFFRRAPVMVTCGSRCVPTSTQPIAELGSTLMFTAGQGSVTLLAQVENPNTNAAAQTFAYQFDLLDASGAVVQSIPAESFAYAGEVKYLLAPNQAIAPSAMQVSLALGSTTWVSTSTLGSVPDLSFQNIAATADPESSAITVTAELTDQDISSFQNILVIAVFEDATGAPVGASQSELDGIAPNQSENVSIAYPALPTADLSNTKLFAYALRP